MITKTPAWQALYTDKDRAAGPASKILRVDDLVIDLSRQPIDEARWQKLLAMVEQQRIMDWRRALFSSVHVNSSEDRAAEHWALRQQPLRADLAAVDARLHSLVNKIRSHEWLGVTGKPIKSIVNIGIGGSDLGPRLLTQALPHLRTPTLDFYFVANIDPAELASILPSLNPEETLFIVASKSFSTLETKLNAAACRQWLLSKQKLDSKAVAKHFVAVTSNTNAATEFGISAETCFDFPDSIGGRYSVWGPVGLAARIALGNETFAMLRQGAAAIDAHFNNADISENAPILLALASLWHMHFAETLATAILPYAHALSLLPAYLQQLIMESNGKNITQDGTAIDYPTAPIVFGAPGTLGQHSFYQLLHQGTVGVAADILYFDKPNNTDLPESVLHHQWLVANATAQADSLWQGRRDASMPAHRQFKGQHPVTVLHAPQLTPFVLGQLLALYEHKTFVHAGLLGINPFDQWGVELGKELADTHFARQQKA